MSNHKTVHLRLGENKQAPNYKRATSVNETKNFDSSYLPKREWKVRKMESEKFPTPDQWVQSVERKMG